jgi:hypothetical protein
MSAGTKNRIAALLALIIGALPIYAGTRVLTGIDVPSHPVLDWLVIYNVTLGVISVLMALFLWNAWKGARPVSLLIMAAHLLVFLWLLSMPREEVALKSQVVMGVRTATWVLINVLYTHEGKPKERSA